ncbi:MAG: NAD(P)H-hydrate dehydratase [Christensenella sp.]|nr:NAD(P)H-hydrate dehydratase [Christensenella sp.]
MHIALTPAQMGAVDQYMIETKKIPSIILMENAAHAVFDAIAGEMEPCSVQVFCGMGNNGGDGLAVARILLANGYDVQVVLLGDSSHMTRETQTQYAFFETQENGVTWLADEEGLEDLPQADVYVDALFGTGLSRYVEGLYAQAIRHINAQEALVVSVDIPSGINAQTGAVMHEAINADITVTFQYPKIGHFMFPGREKTGQLQIAKIGVDDGCDIPLQANVGVYESDDEDMCIGAREKDSNKGSYGRLLLVAGSRGMAGAAVLCARAASRAGAGLVTAVSTPQVIDVLQHTVPEATCHMVDADATGTISAATAKEVAALMKGKTALAIGPGLGLGDGARAVVEEAITQYDMVKVLDADALNVIAADPGVLEDKEGELVLTPHPKEFARLLDISVEQVLSNPMKYAVQFAMEYDVILVLKGATTIIADPFGNVSLLCVGTPGMAKGGSGDVLTGLISGFAAQGKDAYEAALMGVYVAGMAGEYAAHEIGEYSMTPMDTVNCVGMAIGNLMVDYVKADTVSKKEDYEEFDKEVEEMTEEPAASEGVDDLYLRQPFEDEEEEGETGEEIMDSHEKPAFLEKYMDEPTMKHERVAVEENTDEEQEYIDSEEDLEEEEEDTPGFQETMEMKREILEELGRQGDNKPTRRKIG